MLGVRVSGSTLASASSSSSTAHFFFSSAIWKTGSQTPMAQGRSTEIVSMIQWIRTSRLSIKKYLSPPPALPLRVQGVRVSLEECSGCRVQGLGFRVQDSGFRVQGSGFRVKGSGCRASGFGAWAGLLGAPLSHTNVF